MGKKRRGLGIVEKKPTRMRGRRQLRVYPPRLGPPQRRADLAVWQIPLVAGSLGSYNSHKGEKRKRPRRGEGDTIIVARKVYTQKREQGRRGGGGGKAVWEVCSLLYEKVREGVLPRK